MFIDISNGNPVDYWTPADAAVAWETTHAVRAMLQRGLIPEQIKIGRNVYIPKGRPKPVRNYKRRK